MSVSPKKRVKIIVPSEIRGAIHPVSVVDFDDQAAGRATERAEGLQSVMTLVCGLSLSILRGEPNRDRRNEQNHGGKAHQECGFH
jgi:hypothetical protein